MALLLGQVRGESEARAAMNTIQIRYLKMLAANLQEAAERANSLRNLRSTARATGKCIAWLLRQIEYRTLKRRRKSQAREKARRK